MKNTSYMKIFILFILNITAVENKIITVVENPLIHDQNLIIGFLQEFCEKKI